MAKRRSKGDGHIGQRHDHPTCPPLIDGPPDDDGKPTKIRPQHTCRGTHMAQINVAPPGAPRKRKTIYGKTKAEARRKLAEVVEQHKAGNYTTTSMTFGAWLDYWLDNIVDVRPNTKHTYARIARLYLKPELGKVRLDRLNLDHPPRLKNSLSHVSPGTKRGAHRLAGTAIQAAMERGLMTTNPFKAIAAPKSVKKKRRALESAELDKLLDLILDRPDEARWILAVVLGPRQGECLGLTWDRVNFDKMELDFEWQAQRIPWRHGCTDTKPCGYKRAYRCPHRAIDAPDDFDYEPIESNICWVPPKTTASRRIAPLPLALVGPLRRRWVEYLEQKLDPDFTDHGLVFARSDGSPLDDREDYWTWRALLDEAGIDAIALHAARNTAATELLRRGVNEKVSMSIMGHSDARMTQSYQQADLSLARAAIDAPRKA